MMRLSGCDGVMIGRAAYGRPWLAGEVARGLGEDTGSAPLTIEGQKLLLLQLQDDTLTLYGETLGNKTFRKHLGWTIGRLQEQSLISPDEATRMRGQVLPSNDNARVRDAIRIMFETLSSPAEAA